jgi:hypothetical protein
MTMMMNHSDASHAERGGVDMVHTPWKDDEKLARRERIYADMVARMPLKEIARWLTETCTECGDSPTEGMSHAEVRDAMGQDGVWLKPCNAGVEHIEGTEDEFDHLMLGRFVIRGCEGYWLINPTVLGFEDRGSWSDWTFDFDEDFG